MFCNNPFDPTDDLIQPNTMDGRVHLESIKFNILKIDYLLWHRFCHDVFDRDYKATIGVDFEVEKFSVLSIPFTLQM